MNSRNIRILTPRQGDVMCGRRTCVASRRLAEPLLVAQRTEKIDLQVSFWGERLSHLTWDRERSGENEMPSRSKLLSLGEQVAVIKT